MRACPPRPDTDLIAAHLERSVDFNTVGADGSLSDRLDSSLITVPRQHQWHRFEVVI